VRSGAKFRDTPDRAVDCGVEPRLIFGVATVVATTIVPDNRRGAAVAWLFAGITVANILGVPAGTAIGNWFGWRAAFWAVGILAVAVTFTIMSKSFFAAVL
jgi:predicted MFS family arabinose efflux permease